MKFFKKAEKGIALLITLFAILVMSFLAFELSYNSHVELAVGASHLDRMRAYYLAKSGVEISALRIHLFRTALDRFGKDLGANKGVLNMIWQFPFGWPPQIPKEMGIVDKGELDQAIKESYIDGSFLATIEGEGGKIDINDLGSPSEKLRKSTTNQLLNILKTRLDAEDDWAKNNRGKIRPEEIVNNITDWVDEDQKGSGGGGEPTNSLNGETIRAPNRPLKTIAELHMIPEVTDEIYNTLAPRITVYGVKGINVNTAPAEVVQSIDKQITTELAGQIVARRNDPELGPFKDANDFTSFIQTKLPGFSPDKFNKDPEIPLLFDSEYNFRIRASGHYKKAQREIVAIVYDFDKVKEQLVSQLAPPAQTSTQGQGAQGTTSGAAQGGTTNPTPTPTPTTAPQTRSGPPQIVFWEEF